MNSVEMRPAAVLCSERVPSVPKFLCDRNPPRQVGRESRSCRDESSGIAPQPEQDKQGRHENLSQGKAEVCACLMQFTRLFCQCAMREANELFCAQSRHSSLFTCCEVCIFAPAIRHNPVCSRKMRREAQETLFTSTWCKPSRLLPVRRLALSCGRGR